MSQREVDVLTSEFYGAFDNRGGKQADLARLRRLFVPGGLIIHTGAELTVYGVEDFIAPREGMLADGGRLTEFAEWETAAHTDIADGVASRTGEYAKSGVLDGEPFEGAGVQAIQFVRTPDGWRISCYAWHDHP
ncbi:DUF4440 domain-containing protein [Streptomyces sp. NPDC051940]|uniref:nuclear transport factor 2 family protein n=1 Tax=Streptomyces sp. NPDC051940 TaxID=3155675 RepID=UPI003440986D